MRSAEKAPVSFRRYSAYISSSAWRAKRKAFVAAGYARRCWGCGKAWGSGDHVHHRSYKHLGAEPFEDLVPLCERCHARVHELFETPAGKKRGLWATTDLVVNPRFVTLPGDSSSSPSGRPRRRGAGGRQPKRAKPPKLDGLSHKQIARLVAPM